MDAESDSDADQQETTEVAEEEQEVVKKEKRPKEKCERRVKCKACDKLVVVSSAMPVPKTESQKNIFVDLLLGCDEESAQEILDNKWRGKWVCKYHVPGMRIYSRKPKKQEYTESEPESELELVLEKEGEGVVPVVPIEPIEREYSLRQRAQRSYKDDLEEDAIAQLEEIQKQYLLEQQMIAAGILPAPIEKARKTPVQQQVGKYRYHCRMCDKRSRAPCLYIPREPWQRAKFLSFVSLSECTREMRREIMEGKWVGQRICAFHAPEWIAWKHRWSKPMSSVKQSVGGRSSEGIQAQCKREMDELEYEKPTISVLLRETGLVKLEEPDPDLTGELGTETPSSASEGSSPVNGTSGGGGSGNAEFNVKTCCQVCGQKRCSPAFVVPKSPWWKAKFVSCLLDCSAEVKQEMMEGVRPQQRICASHAPAWFEWKARWKKQETIETPNSTAKEPVPVPAKSTGEAVCQSARLLPSTEKMQNGEKPVQLPFRLWSSTSKYQNGLLPNEPFPLPASAFYCVLCETNVHQPLLCVPRPGQKLLEFVERLVGCTEETKKEMKRGAYSQMPICGHHAPNSRKRSWDHDRTGDRSEGRVVPIQPRPTRTRSTIQTSQLPSQSQSVSVPTSALFRNVKREIGDNESSQPPALSYQGKGRSEIDEELEESEETARPISEDVVRFGSTITAPTCPPRLCIVCRQIVTCAVYGVPKEPWQRRKLVECMTDCNEKIKEGILAGRLYRTSFCTKHAPGGGEQWNVSHPKVLEELHDLFTSGPSHSVNFYEKILYKLNRNKHQSATVRDGDEYTVQKLKTEIKTEDGVEETGTSFPASQEYGSRVAHSSVKVNARKRIDPSVVETVKREIKTELVDADAEGAPTSSISEGPAQAQGGLNQYPIPIPVPKPIPLPSTGVMPYNEEDCSRVRPMKYRMGANQASKPIVTKTFPKLLPRPSSVKVTLPRPSSAKVPLPRPSPAKVPLPRPSSAKVPLPRPSSDKVPLPRPSSDRVTSNTGEDLDKVGPTKLRRRSSSTTTPFVTQHFPNLLPKLGPGPSSGRVIASGGGEDCSRVRPAVSKVGSSPSLTSQPAATKPFPKLLPKPSGTVISNSGEDSRDCGGILPTTAAYPMGPVVIKPSQLPTLLQGSHVKVVKFLPYSRPSGGKEQ